jgi:hypothetical protein
MAAYVHDCLGEKKSKFSFSGTKRRFRIWLLDFSNQFYLPPILCFSSHFDFGWELVEETRSFG